MKSYRGSQSRVVTEKQDEPTKRSPVTGKALDKKKVVDHHGSVPGMH